MTFLFTTPLDQFDVVSFVLLYVEELQLDFSFFNIFLPYLFMFTFIFILLLIMHVNLYLIPTVLQYIMELYFIFIFSLFHNQVGPIARWWFTILIFIFFIILFNNFCSLLPYGIALTAHIIIILWLTHSLCVSIFLKGLQEKGLHYLMIFVPTAPPILVPLLSLIEIFSYVLRSFSLGIRLSANIMAGHTLLFIVSEFITDIVSCTLMFNVIGLWITVPIILLEMAVSGLQAYVFSILGSIFVNEIYAGHGDDNHSEIGYLDKKIKRLYFLLNSIISDLFNFFNFKIKK